MIKFRYTFLKDSKRVTARNLRVLVDLINSVDDIQKRFINNKPAMFNNYFKTIIFNYLTYHFVTDFAYKWVFSSIYENLPPNAVKVGIDSDGSPIYLGRTDHKGDQLPVKVIPSIRHAAVCYGGNAIQKTEFEVK